MLLIYNMSDPNTTTTTTPSTISGVDTLTCGPGGPTSCDRKKMTEVYNKLKPVYDSLVAKRNSNTLSEDDKTEITKYNTEYELFDSKKSSIDPEGNLFIGIEKIDLSKVQSGGNRRTRNKTNKSKTSRRRRKTRRHRKYYKN